MRRLILIITLLTLMLAFGTTVFAQGDIAHVVQPGENLFRISLRYNVPMATIAARNGITNFNVIFAGTTIYVPTSGGTPGTSPTPVPPQVTPVPPQTVTYTVVAGDTLGSIARRFNTTFTDIAQRNNIVNPNLIYPGQVLTISGGGTAPVPTPPPNNGGTPVSGGFELGGQVFSFSYPSQMHGMGMKWAKSQVVYNLGDPASIAQGAIDAAHSNGFKILLSIKGNPAQIAANPTQYYQNFATFLAGVAQLGPEGIEVWNEQNIDREWPVGLISGAQYAQMLSAAYQAIKGANQNVLVISGAPSPTGFFGGACTPNGCDDAPFLQQMAQAGAGQFLDCVGVHYNEGILSPTQSSGDPRGNGGHYTRYYSGMVNTYASVFPNKPLCFTELGYLSPEGYSPLPSSFSWAAGTSAQEQAVWLSEAVTLSRQSNRIRLLIVWNVDSTEYGADPQAGYAIIRPDNSCNACNTLSAAMAGS